MGHQERLGLDFPSGACMDAWDMEGPEHSDGWIRPCLQSTRKHETPVTHVTRVTHVRISLLFPLPNTQLS